MKSHNTNSHRLMVILGTTLIVVSTTTSLASSGYAQDSEGKVITNAFGACVQTSAWTSDLSTPECDPALAARLEADRLAAEDTRRAAELAALERSTPVTTMLRVSDESNVMFKFNSAVLTPAATQDLESVLSQIRDLDGVDGIDIIGHTDSTGPERYNQSLSERRAESVRQFLESHGVHASLLKSHGQGEADPVADNNSREGRAKNRRVDILVRGNIVD